MRWSLCARIVAGVTLAVVTLAPARAEEPADSGPLAAGPLRFRDQFVLSLGFLAPEPAAARVAPPGAWQLDAVWTLSNSWAPSAVLELELDARERREPITQEQLERLAGESPEGGLVLADGEVSRTVLALRRGFRGGFQIELAIPLLRFSGGGLDSLVESFHRAFGVEQAGRLGAPKDDLYLFLDTPEVEYTERRGSSVELGDLVLAGKVRLLDQSSRPLSLSFEALVKLPTGAEEPLSTSGEIDVGARLLAGRTFGRWSAHGSVAAVQLGGSERLGVRSKTLLSATLGVERSLGGRTSLVLQGSASESPFRGVEISRLGERSVQLTAGIKRAVGRRNVLFAGVTENLENFNNSADINLHLGISRALD